LCCKLSLKEPGKTPSEQFSRGKAKFKHAIRVIYYFRSVRKTFLLFGFLSIIFTSCTSGGGAKPANLLTHAQMTRILADIHMAESMADMHFPSRDTSKIAYKILEKKIFAQHQVEDSVFLQSYEYYLRHLKEMDKIYEAVVDTLNLRELRLNNRNNSGGPTNSEAVPSVMPEVKKVKF
jgi:hypothetical protein